MDEIRYTLRYESSQVSSYRNTGYDTITRCFYAMLKSTSYPLFKGHLERTEISKLSNELECELFKDNLRHSALIVAKTGAKYSQIYDSKF